MQNTMLIYSDGSGNTWQITIDSIKYLPITPEVSSSGEYSGGKAVEKKIGEKEFIKVYQAFDEIFNQTKIHISNRIMTSGMLQVKDGNRTIKSVIIEPCEEKDKLENILKELIKE